MCTPPWSASRTCSCGPARGRTVPVLRSVPRWVSCTSTLCSPGLCCWPSAPAVKSKKYYKSETFCSQLFANLCFFVFFAMFYSLTHILSCTDFCPNFQGCWRVTMSIWGLLQEKQSLCFLSWPETWTRWVLFKGIPLFSSVCVLLSFVSVLTFLFPCFFFLSQEFDFDQLDELCDKLNALATDCNKHRAKTDKKKQRSVFRDVLKAVEVSWCPSD